ncbi:hypothetical protein [Lysinibacter cavernae]|uniref:Transcriptional regulator, AbiEi antitoxin, Type IV TA system n=1 Tax=Lysinibacter cavernae TaxID=1640652 RepID=A0A7X5TU07_9MICO|nr:hypothetical protein [Lysinibacter cavernae]NIH53873.1 hypothetical protein [Lysinibacter cavernae]
MEHEIMARGLLTSERKNAADVRVHVGSYLAETEWAGLHLHEQHLLRVISHHIRFPDTVFSHRSAAAALGIPLVGPWPTRIHRYTRASEKDQSTRNISTHRCGAHPVETTTAYNMIVTSTLRTVVDLARTETFINAVCAVDWLLARNTEGAKEDMKQLLSELRPRYGRHQAYKAIGLGTELSESVGESASRAIMEIAGFKAPVLQQRFHDTDGLIGLADFWWPDEGVIGEFDGHVKYVDPEYTHGRSATSVVVDERRRENRLSALPHVRNVVRWDWSCVTSPATLIARLQRAGVPR